MDSQMEMWKRNYLKELKLDSLGTETSKVNQDNLSVPILSTQSCFNEISFANAPLSVWGLTPDELVSSGESYLKKGIMDFFLDESTSRRATADPKLVEEINRLKSLGARFIISSSVGDGSLFSPLTARSQVQNGCSGLEEIVHLIKIFNEYQEKNDDIYLEIYLDNFLFQSIARVRALKLLIQENKKIKNFKGHVHILGRVNPRSFSVLDEENNILRNSTAVMAGYLAGVSAMESLPFTYLRGEFSEDSLHLSISTQLILQAESHLQFVDDPSFGSFSIEALTVQYMEDTKKYLANGAGFNYFEEKMKDYYHGKKNLTGVNEYPLPTQKIKPIKTSFKRWADDFEEIRLKFQKLKQPLNILCLTLGDYAGLQPRLHFVKNLIEISGIEMIDPGKGFHHPNDALKSHSEKVDIIIWVAKDKDYSLLAPDPKVKSFIAGNVSVSGYEKITKGINKLDILGSILNIGLNK